MLDTTVVIETFNYLEGTSLSRVRVALTAAVAFSPAPGGTEVVVADVTDDPAIRRMLECEFPAVRRVSAVNLGYDEAKMLAAREAKGRYVVYLDCDCVPEPGWFEQITAPLRAGTAVATGGFARYPGGFFATLQGLLDFGFLLPREDRPLGCYASNNSAFVREVLLRVPEPDGPMRCRCYAHAQHLMRLGTPVMMAAGAAVEHERPPFFRERLRQGYDVIASCWVDPELPEAAWLSRGVAAAPLFYRHRVQLDRLTVRANRRFLRLSHLGAKAARGLLALMRLVDLVGMIGALWIGPRARGLFDLTYRRAPGAGGTGYAVKSARMSTLNKAC